jgi:N6-adenosine-specific RNA methylase IME4
MTNKFNVILVDAPWRYSPRNNPKTKFGKGMTHYPGLTQRELCELPVADLAADNCALFMWAVSPKLPQLFPIMEAWGFRYVNKAFTWVKVDKKGAPRALPGWYVASNSEDVYLGIKGKMEAIDKGVRQPIIERLSGIHSRKPAEVRTRIERLFGDVPRIELFATEIVDGWHPVGNAVDGLDIRDSLQLIQNDPEAHLRLLGLYPLESMAS